MEVTFESLPKAVSQLYLKVESLERLLLARDKENQPEPDRWFNLPELCEYLPDNPAHATVYGLVHRREIPHHKGGKHLRFLKSEIDAWLKEGRRKTIAELRSEANKPAIGYNIEIR